MHLDSPFTRLPLDFDAERLSAEVLAVPESAWRPHPQGNPGNSALPLIAAGGDPDDDSTRGPMAPTPHLAGLEYLQQVLQSFQTVFGRTRLMRLEGNTEATLHVDTNYYWAERVRVHVPIVTSPAIQFVCDDTSLHMPAGQSWIFDAWRRHNVLNTTGDRRIHLVADTTGSAPFWALVDQGAQPFGPPGRRELQSSRFVPHRPGERAVLEVEQHNYPPVMSPWELTHLADGVVRAGLRPVAGPVGGASEAQQVFDLATTGLLRHWRAIWSRFGDEPGGVGSFRRLLQSYAEAIEPTRGRLVLPNGSDAVEIAHQMLIRPAINEDLRGTWAQAPAQAAPATGAVRPAAVTTPRPTQAAGVTSADAPVAGPRAADRFDRPVFVVAPPRSGTSLLFETLALAPDLWTIGGESHRVIEQVPGLHPASRGWDSNRLGAADAQPAVVEQLAQGFLAQLRDRHDRTPDDRTAADTEKLRLLEKTPKNSLRVPFLAEAFPDARFVYIHREPQECLSSMIAAWESGRFVTYPDLPGWEGRPWSLLLTPEWRSLVGRSLPEVVAHQWRMSSEILTRDLDRLASDRWAVVGYHNLLADPQGEVERLCEFLGLGWDNQLDGELPLSRHTLTPPRADKWRQHAAELDAVLPGLGEVAERSRDLLAKPLVLTPRLDDPVVSDDSPYRSVSGGDFAGVLTTIGGSLLVSTYQTGKVVVLRAHEGRVNSHFRSLESPMGIAHDRGRLAIGTRTQVWEYQDVPGIVDTLQPAGLHDACFVPRVASWTGDIRVHDIGWAGGELWTVNTRFSCLSTLDGVHSFVPRWQPPFITALAAEDRCHLNGMCIIDDEVRYVTALGVSDEAGGWRAKKADGGVVIDVRSGEVVVEGLSMPHSPRWHRDRLWALESGQGSLVRLDPATGAVETVAQLPGFTRGLAFVGKWAFVGLSEVREATTFGGLPLTARLEERECGVWVVDIENGATVAFLRFEDLVEEVFDVCFLPGRKFPEIAEHGSSAVRDAFLLP